MDGDASAGPGPEPPRSGLPLAAFGMAISFFSLANQVFPDPNTWFSLAILVVFPLVLVLAERHLRKTEAPDLAKIASTRETGRFQYSLSELMVFAAGVSLVLGAMIVPGLLEEQLAYPLLLVFGILGVTVGLAWHRAWLRWARRVAATARAAGDSPEAERGIERPTRGVDSQKPTDKRQ